MQGFISVSSSEGDISALKKAKIQLCLSTGFIITAFFEKEKHKEQKLVNLSV